MQHNEKRACLFDLDGVILDTEAQYTKFWGGICQEFLGDENLCQKIKGNTLEHIYATLFSGKEKEQQEITSRLKKFEASMQMEYIPGAKDFLQSLKENDVPTSLVTSSNAKKMESVYLNHPKFTQLFDHILTAENFKRSKPFPEPYLLGAEVCNANAKNCFVFEDSFNGMKSGRSAGAIVVGLATTNSASSIAPYADIIINDFTEITWQKLLCK
ncbi:MAG: HAD family phosphatase [Treponema sp.]|nr:HAD family phosphatase [Treponema sp.]